MGSRSRYTDEQRLAILKELEEHGLSVTLRKHGLYAKSIYLWREKLQNAEHSPTARKRSVDGRNFDVYDERISSSKNCCLRKSSRFESRIPC